MTAEIIPLLPKGSPSAEFRSAWSAYPETGRRRSSTADSWKEWQRAIKASGWSQLTMLEAVKRYVSEDKDHKRECGPPAFHRWLKWGRWEHWSPKLAVEISHTQPKTFPDKALRAAFHLRFQDDRARQWFDRCRLEGDEIVGPLDMARQEWLTGPFQDWAVLNGIGGMRRTSKSDR